MTTLTPAALDQAAARLVDNALIDDQLQRITSGYQRTAPASPAARGLLTKTVDELVQEALGGITPHGTRPAIDIRLPGRIARTLPDWTQKRRTTHHPASTQLHVAAAILREWGWQGAPHKLRDRLGRRCICGAICATVTLGIGTTPTAHHAAWHVLTELRHRGWTGLIGDWNQAPGRTQQQAIDLVQAAARRAEAEERDQR